MEHEYNPAAVTPLKTRGRPVKKLDLHEVECRVTPPDGKRPEFDMTPFTKFVAFEEGGAGTDKALHYHILLETDMSDYCLAQHWNTAFPTGAGSGNKLFRNGVPHEKTKSYIAKFKTPVAIKGYTESDLQAWYKESDEYVSALKRERERYRKIKSMGRKAELKSVEQDVMQVLNDHDEYTDDNYLVRRLIERFLQLCKERNYEFPTRTQMDTIIMRIMYTRRPAYVLALYSRNLVLG